VKFPLRPSLPVEGYEGIELRVKTDGRTYITNLEVSVELPYGVQRLSVSEGQGPNPCVPSLAAPYAHQMTRCCIQTPCLDHIEQHGP
jgi:hypothetical protein